MLNAALTNWALFMTTTVHVVAVPEHAPLQPPEPNLLRQPLSGSGCCYVPLKPGTLGWPEIPGRRTCPLHCQLTTTGDAVGGYQPNPRCGSHPFRCPFLFQVFQESPGDGREVLAPRVQGVPLA